MAGWVVPERRLRIGEFVLCLDSILEVLNGLIVVGFGHCDFTEGELIGDVQEARSGIINRVEEMDVSRVFQRDELFPFGSCFFELTFVGIRSRSDVMPDAVGKFEVFRWLRFCQHFVPVSKLCQGQHGNRVEELNTGELFNHLEPDVRRDFSCGFDGDFAATFHARGGPEKMDVVRVIGGRVKALGVAARDIGLVNGRGRYVRLGGVVVAAYAPVDMSGHVHEVSRAGNEVGQCVGWLLSSVRIR